MAYIDDVKTTEEFMQNVAKEFDDLLKLAYERTMGFTILIYDFNMPGTSNYVSNSNRNDIIKALRETADRLEAKNDIGKVIGTA